MINGKYWLFGLLCFLFCGVNLFAAKLVSVKSGDISVIKKPSISLLELDFSNTKVGDETLLEYQQRHGDDYVRDWPDAAEATRFSFMEFFNKKNKKGMQFTPVTSEASYKMVIRVNYLNMGDSFSRFIAGGVTGFSGKAGGMLMKGSIDIIDMRTNSVVCTIDIDGVKGAGNPSLQIRLQSAFNYLAENVRKLK